MLKRILKVFVLLICAFCLTGCYTIFEVFEYNSIKRQGLKYLKDKYGEKFEVTDGRFIEKGWYIYGSHYDDVFLKIDDEFTVYYNADEDKFYDDRETEKIVEDLNEEILEPILANLGDYRISGDVHFNQVVRNRFSGEFFHKKYNDDIKDYIEKEKIYAMLDNIWYFSDSYSWRSKFDKFYGELKDVFEAQEEDGYVILTVYDRSLSSLEDSDVRKKSENLCYGRIYATEKVKVTDC